MKIKKVTVINFLVYSSLILSIISPALATKLGLPFRLDTVLVWLYLFALLIWIMVYGIEKKIKTTTFLILGMTLVSIFSLILNFDSDRMIGTAYYISIAFYFYFIYLFEKYNDFDVRKIRKLLIVLSSIVFLGFFLELLFGIQLVNGTDGLSILDGMYKGFYFNSNNQAVAIAILASAIAFFFIINNRDLKSKFIGYIYFFVAGLVVFISASRATLSGYLITLVFILFINANKAMRTIYLLLSSSLIVLFFDIRLLLPVLHALEKIRFLEVPVERFELAIFNIDADKSVDYRSEIYVNFLKNFKILWFGYSPENYTDYFTRYPLSLNLGYTNPHSFFIDIYLAFGIFAFIFFILFFMVSSIEVIGAKLSSTQKFYYVFMLLLFSWLVWVPSSILRFPLVWISIFLIYAYSKKDNKYSRLKGSDYAKTHL